MPKSSIQDYEKYHQLNLRFDQKSITAFSKPGLEHWQSVLPAELLITRHIASYIEGKVLLLGCRNGALGAYIVQTRPDITLWMSDDTCLALACTQLTQNFHQLTNTHIIENFSLLPEFESFFDAVIFLPDKGRKLARRKLLEGFWSLKPSGRMVVAGSKTIGIKSMIADAGSLFACTPKILGYKKGSRAVLLEKTNTQPACEWSDEPGIAPQSWHTFENPHCDKKLIFFALPGVFSYDRLDEGTALLLESLPLDIEGAVLDVGCGCGVIGISLASRDDQRIHQIDMVDSNLLAVASARYSLLQNRSLISATPQIMIQAGDLMDGLPDHTYDVIVTNPPFHTGQKTNYDVAHALIAQSPRVLRPTGSLILVANHFLRYEKLLVNYFNKVEIIRKTNRFHVISASSLR